MRLAGKVALVTGAGAPRLGRAIALGLGRRGVRIAVHHHRSAAGAEATVRALQALGADAAPFAADLTDPAAVEALPKRVADRLGGLDILVHNAAHFQRTPLGEATVDSWDELFALNLRAPFFLTQAALPWLRRSGEGRVICVADSAGLRPFPSYLPYSVSKAGLISLTRGLARALAPAVTVNAIAPGLVLPETGMGPAEIARALRPVPLGRPGRPEDLVEAVLYLVEKGDHLTGCVLPLDGGRAET